MMDRNDIAILADEIFEEFVAHPPENPQEYSIRMTSGTTSGSPFLTVWHTKNAAEWRPDSMHRLILAFGPLAMRTSNMLYFRNNPDNEGALMLPLDVAALEPSAERLLKDFAADSMYGFPSFVTRISEHMSAGECASVDILGFSGEAISKTLRDIFTSRFPHARQVITFASAETGVISTFPCDYLSPGHYHPRKGIDIEVSEPDADGVGYFLISKDLLYGKRMEGYKTGDMARMVPEACPCGEKVTFEVLGRAGYDFVKVAGAILRREEFDRAASECAALFDDYRAEAEAVIINGKLKGKIRLTIYRAKGAASKDEISREFSSRVYLTPSQTLSQLVEKELFLPLIVTVSTESLPQAGKSMKLSLHK